VFGCRSSNIVIFSEMIIHHSNVEMGLEKEMIFWKLAFAAMYQDLDKTLLLMGSSFSYKSQVLTACRATFTIKGQANIT
jgi:hypothetical protein